MESTFRREFYFSLMSKLERKSPAPTCSPFISDQSEDEDIKSRMRPGQIPSPCLSFKSNSSMSEPLKFSRGNISPYNRCSICKDVLREPVSIPCGHNFCKTCIQSYWEKPTYEQDCSCPLCRKRFKTRPVPDIDMTLDLKLKHARFSPSLPAGSYAGPEHVTCDICVGSKIRAVKWCLTCSAAYCESHVRQHYTVEALQRHTLIEATEDPETRTCRLHRRALEVFCQTDNVLLCLVCVLEEHKDHNTFLIKGGSHAPEAKSRADLHERALHLLSERKMNIMRLLKHNELLTAKVKNLKRAESELSHLTKHFCRGLQDATDLTSEFVEVAALGRQLDLGMLYDCRSDSFHSDLILWEKNLISSMKLSIPRPQTDVRVLEEDTLQNRLTALDLSGSLRASVVSGMVEMAGASAFFNHPVQSELQERVTLHYRISTRLDMLSHKLLESGFPLSVTGSTTATHVVVAVLYGSQALVVLNKKKDKSAENTDLQDIIKKMIASSSHTDLLYRLTEISPTFCDCATFMDGVDLQCSANGTLQNAGAVPLKAWLYPLKNLDQTSACVAKDISEDQLYKAENILGKLKSDMSFCQHLMSIDGGHDVFTLFPALKDALSEFSSLLQQYQSNFQKRLASCVKIIRDTGAEEEEQNLQDLLESHNQSPLCSTNMRQWLQNKNAQVRALIQCRSANIEILNSQNEIQRVVQDSPAERALCLVFTSLKGEDKFLSALRRNIESGNTAMATETQQEFRISDESQNIFCNLQSFLFNKETSENMQETMFIAASLPDSCSPGSSIYLYQSGILVSRNVRLEDKPNPAEIVKVQQTRVMIKLQTLKTQMAERYRVEYKAVKEQRSPADTTWSVISCTEENCVVLGLVPGTPYQLRYAITDRDSMTDYSIITEFQTASRARPGPPTVLKLNKESLYIAWHMAETDESPVLCYIVEYLEAGLEGWQPIQINGSVCEYTITLPYTTCYRARVSAVYGPGDKSAPSEETKVPVRVWSIDLSKRKASVFLEILQLQTTKKSVKLRDFTDKESEVQSFLQCLSYISQLSIDPPQTSRESLQEWRRKVTSFLINLCLQAAIHQKDTIQETVQKLPLCYFKTHREQSTFILDLYSRAKDYEIQTGENVQPALQAVYQTLPEVWSINLSERMASLFLEVLKLQTVKRAVQLRGLTEEESEMRSLLQCLPYISQLSFVSLQTQRECPQERKKRVRRFLLDLCLQAALHQKEKIQTIVTKCFKNDTETSIFLLLLYAHIRDYETRTGTTVLPALQTVFESIPKIWSINLSDKKTSLFPEVLKLQPLKKAVELRGWSEEESEMRILLQCLPYISQLRFGFAVHGKRRRLTTLRFLVNLIAGVSEHSAETGESFTELLASLCSFRTFSFHGDDHEFDSGAHCNVLLDLYLHAKDYEGKTGRSVIPTLLSVYESLPDVWTINLTDTKALHFLEMLKLQTAKKAVELTGWSNEKRKVRSFFQYLPHVSQLRLCTAVLVRMAQAKALWFRAPMTLDELMLIESSAQQPEGTSAKILKSLDFLLRHLEIQCLNLTEYKTASQIGFLNLQGPLTVRFCEETLQILATVVYESQDEALTHRFLQNVGGDLTSCSLSWDAIFWFLQHHTVTVDLRRSTIKPENIQELLPVLNRVHLRGLKSTIVLSIMRNLYETASTHGVSGLLSSTKNCVSLENRKLDSVDCAALRFTLEHCTGVSLNLLWTSIPEGELESIVPLLSHVGHLRVDRLLLLRLLHCCSVPHLQQEAAVLLTALHHRLDFSCRDALDLTADVTTDCLFLSSDDCQVISTAIQRAHTHVQLTIQDCEIEEAGVEQLFSVLHTVTLSCSKALLLRFLSLLHVGTQADQVRRAAALSRALRDKVDLRETKLNSQACKALALVLKYSEGVSELDLSHCQLTDHELEPLMPHLHKTCILDLSHNHITDVSAKNIHHMVSVNGNIRTVSLFSNRITDSSLFLEDERFEIW